MKKTLILVTALFVIITVIVILGNVITIGEKITSVLGVPYWSISSISLFLFCSCIWFFILCIGYILLLNFPFWLSKNRKMVFPMKSIKIPGFAIDSILDGIANTIMTLRIGYVTRSYLKKGAKELKGVKGAYVRKEAMISALKNFPVLLAEIPQRVGTGAWSKVIELLTKIYKVEEESMEENIEVKERKQKKKRFFHFFS
ncbi:MAG: hypothetical protein IJ726_04655 [Phocaeicola sp.]|nr:hypothetical protein [Phocaeicola sp.]